ncbi:STAS domain-containing protein [Agilicoccus flavus]|uniref:STAS domain-containing protein n=1 Tax=Agilicoccus flavus TaxID=2775968 RepID=UPI001CF6495D|nr:STAS domain-containing protein [Agilicoccus flavus]
MDASLHFAAHPCAARLRIEGEVNAASREQLEWALLDLEQLGCATLRLDLGGVTRIEPECLRLLDATRARAVARGVDVRLTAVSPSFASLAAGRGHHELAALADRCRAVPRPDAARRADHASPGAVVDERPATG